MMSLEELMAELRNTLTEWRDAGGPVDLVVIAIVNLAVRASGGIVKK